MPPRTARRQFLADMDTLGEAVEIACAEFDPAFRRVNLEILGNHDPYLHAHVWPRYDWEPTGIIQGAVWLYPPERWNDPDTSLSDVHAPLRRRLRAELDRLHEAR